MKIVFVDNYDSFAQMIAAYFENAGCKVIMYRSDVHPDSIQKEQPDMILLGPGPNGPKEAGNYLKIIDRFHKTTPLFGICLGFQAIMQYFGKEIKPLKETIHGASSKIQHDGKTIFKNIPKESEFARYHSLGTLEVPTGFEISASYDGIVMAARHKKLLIECIQFHPESILSMRNDVGRKLIENVVRHYERNLE